MKTEISEPRKPSLAEDESLRREMLNHLVDFIHRCSELDIDYKKLSNLALMIQSLETTGE